MLRRIFFIGIVTTLFMCGGARATTTATVLCAASVQSGQECQCKHGKVGNCLSQGPLVGGEKQAAKYCMCPLST